MSEKLDFTPPANDDLQKSEDLRKDSQTRLRKLPFNKELLDFRPPHEQNQTHEVVRSAAQQDALKNTP